MQYHIIYTFTSLSNFLLVRVHIGHLSFFEISSKVRVPFEILFLPINLSTNLHSMNFNHFTIFPSENCGTRNNMENGTEEQLGSGQCYRNVVGERTTLSVSACGLDWNLIHSTTEASIRCESSKRMTTTLSLSLSACIPRLGLFVSRKVCSWFCDWPWFCIKEGVLLESMDLVGSLRACLCVAAENQ